jgi:FKBP-type peptidyl-prolyl cis-trans isomerase (trigger factor)
MNASPAKLDPLLSDFETQEEADSYDRWFRAKVQQALDEPRELSIPHEEVIAEMERVFAEMEAAQKHASD